MSKVDRFWSHEAQNIRCVRESDYDKLGVELVYLKSVEKERNNLRAELAAIKAGQGEAVAYAQAWCIANEGTPAEFLSYSLLVKRSAVLGRPLTWREAIELTALTTNMPDAERDALLAMDDEPPASADAVSVPVELLERLIKYYEDGMSIYGECEELRALLAQSESEG